MLLFSTYKEKFDKKYQVQEYFDCFLPVNETLNATTKIKGVDGKPNEEYYKWQFLYALVNSGMYAKDFIGTEVYFPKGNKSSAPIKFDAAVFDDKDWFEYYKRWHASKDQSALDWLRKHLLAAFEFKKEGGKHVEAVYNQQLKPAMKESERDFCLGVLYDSERLYLFRKHHNRFLRLSGEFNLKGESSTTKELSLHLPETYRNIPTFDELLEWVRPKVIDRSKRTIKDLDRVTGVQS